MVVVVNEAGEGRATETEAGWTTHVSRVASTRFKFVLQPRRNGSACRAVARCSRRRQRRRSRREEVSDVLLVSSAAPRYTYAIAVSRNRSSGPFTAQTIHQLARTWPQRQTPQSSLFRSIERVRLELARWPCLDAHVRLSALLSPIYVALLAFYLISPATYPSRAKQKKPRSAYSTTLRSLSLRRKVHHGAHNTEHCLRALGPD